jgi:hypothetical protein
MELIEEIQMIRNMAAAIIRKADELSALMPDATKPKKRISKAAQSAIEKRRKTIAKTIIHNKS